jgi:hypothetical protein
MMYLEQVKELRAENARLREALKRIETDTEDALTMQFAHDALEGKGT